MDTDWKERLLQNSEIRSKFVNQAQVWIAIYNIFMEPEIRNKY